MSLADVSWWHASAPPAVRHPPLPGDLDVDVAIAGAGFTGLWTAYYLKRADPSLRVCIVERERAGFGASGRNGGWCVASLATPPQAYERVIAGGALRMARAIQHTVDEVGEVSVKEGIDCHYSKGGTIYPAVNPGQLDTLEARARTFHAIGLDDSDYRLLTPEETCARVRIPGVLGGLYTPHCAAIQPYRLAQGLAECVVRHGVELFEDTRVTGLSDRTLVTGRGRVRARVVVRATEAYTAQLAGHRRQLIPVYENMIVTEPIPAAIWDEIGLTERETFEDARRVIYYGQRTADDRIAIGGLSPTYRFGSRIAAKTERSASATRRLEEELARLFPMLGRVRAVQGWGGVLGVPRSWFPSVGLDRESGFAWAGGYVGQGVAASNLAGRTLADLILERPSDLTDLPWVGHRWPNWEPEPARWIGTRGGMATFALADWADAHGHPRVRRATDWVAGKLGLD